MPEIDDPRRTLLEMLCMLQAHMTALRRVRRDITVPDDYLPYLQGLYDDIVGIVNSL